jgi:hypothetical protein
MSDDERQNDMEQKTYSVTGYELLWMHDILSTLQEHHKKGMTLSELGKAVMDKRSPDAITPTQPYELEYTPIRIVLHNALAVLIETKAVSYVSKGNGEVRYYSVW